MGTRGPAPKREAQRRRRNKPDVEVEHADGADEVLIPEADPEWHPVARQWFESLKNSGQSVFYEPSDWALASVIAESMSREFRPQPMVVGRGEFQRIEFVSMPPKGASLAAWLKAMTALMATEGDRRRAALELGRPQPPAAEGGADANVADLDAYRKSLAG